jgi:hypothetical protein
MSSVGLKEWSVTTEAIASGDQTILLRKGGIREDGRHFKIEQDQFFLYPGHYHEGEALLKPEYRDRLRDVAAEDYEYIVTLKVFVEIEEVIEVSSEQEVRALDEFHIWSEDFAVKRFNWKPRHPLNLIIVRGHVLQQPQALTVMPEYAGCKSWIEFIEEYPVGVTTPAIPERRFRSRVDAIKEALAASGTPVN